MHDYRSPDGRIWSWKDVMWFIQTSYMSRRWKGFFPLLFATGLCIEDPALLQDEKKLMVATRDALKQEDEHLVYGPSSPGVIKKDITSVINRAWRRWLWRETGSCPDCPIPITVFIARVIEAMDSDADGFEQHDMLWREYKGEQHGTDTNYHP